MSQYKEYRVQLRPGILGWAVALVGFLIAVFAAIFALGVLLIAVPILIVAGSIQYFIWRWRIRRAMRQQMKDSQVIEGTYRVVEPNRDPEPPNRRLT